MGDMDLNRCSCCGGALLPLRGCWVCARCDRIDADAIREARRQARAARYERLAVGFDPDDPREWGDAR